MECGYCGKETKRLLKCNDCDKFVCPICAINIEHKAYCPDCSVLEEVNLLEEYFEDKYAEKTLLTSS